MEHTHFDADGDWKTSILMSILGYSSGFLGSLYYYGEKALVAFFLGFLGAAAGIICKLVYKKYFKKYFENESKP